MLPAVFYFFSGVALLSALCVVFLPKPTRALLSLIVTMFALSVLYLLLGAPFVALSNIIVYAGAVLVLFLFVIMLQGAGASDIPLTRRFSLGYLALATFVGITFLALILFLFLRFRLAHPAGIVGSVEAFGQVLFRDYLIPFEMTSLLLLIGVFAAVSLAKREDAP